MDGEISRHLQSIKGEGGELKKIDCQFTVNEGGSDKKNITQPFGGSVKFYCNITKILPPVPYSILSK